VSFRHIFAATLVFSALAGLAGCGDDEPNGAAPYSVIQTFAGNGLQGAGQDSVPAQSSALNLPQGVTVGPDGNLYIADWYNHRIRMVKQGVIYTVCGTGTPGSPTVGHPKEISLTRPTGVTFAPDGKLIIFAWENSQILSLDFNADLVQPIAGTGVAGFGGDNGPAIAALLNLPVAGFYDDDGRLVFMDQANQCIRRIETGDITTFAGVPMQPGFVDSVPSAQAKFNLPTVASSLPGGRIVIDASANIYVADTNNQRIRILEPAGPIPAVLSPAHEDYDIRTFAGNGTQGFSGDGGPALNASLDSPSDVAVDSQRNVYIADTNNHCIRKVDTHGVITTFAGTPGSPNGLSVNDVGDGASPTHAFLDRPTGICFDSHDNLYIADLGHNRIRVIWKDPDAHH
jgi:sugar lactone lactonase YvrE